MFSPLLKNPLFEPIQGQTPSGSLAFGRLPGVLGPVQGASHSSLGESNRFWFGSAPAHYSLGFFLCILLWIMPRGIIGKEDSNLLRSEL